MKALNLTGFLDLIYLAPNSWENKLNQEMHLHLIYSRNERWEVIPLGSILPRQNVRFTTHEFNEVFTENTLAIIYPSVHKIEGSLKVLPDKPYWTSHIPEWRNTSGFSNFHAQVSYQSEIYPLPTKGTLLSFHPFIQYSKINNYLLILNLISSPRIFEKKLEIFDSLSGAKYGETSIYTNSVTVIDLDKFDIPETSLPAMVSLETAAIPFGLGISTDNTMLSLEHTHPPASFTLFGDRSKNQSQIKASWFNKLVQK